MTDFTNWNPDGSSYVINYLSGGVWFRHHTDRVLRRDEALTLAEELAADTYRHVQVIHYAPVRSVAWSSPGAQKAQKKQRRVIG